ncbi:hypothetical protein MINS_34860 [Mycolicibacterium insubricum]|nr:hypothetical protein MINS_34860 [Mycolicibacterium insubricum]
MGLAGSGNGVGPSPPMGGQSVSESVAGPVSGPGQTEAAPVVAVVARGIRVNGPWGPVYGPVDLDIDEGGVTVLLCEAGSGRTALQMTLAGRMRPKSGTLSVFGRTRATDIFAHSALAGIGELDNVYESVTVRDLLTEQVRWNSPWYRMVPRADEQVRRRVCGPVFGDLEMPPLDEYVGEVSELDRMLLRIAVANINTPELLVVGNLDKVTSDEDRDVLVERLIALGRSQTVVTSTCNELTGHDVHAQIRVANVSRIELAGKSKGDR